jgi:hypothetical protein
MSIVDAAQEWVSHYLTLFNTIVGLGIPAVLVWCIKEYRSRVRIEIRSFHFAFTDTNEARSVSFYAVNTSDRLTAFLSAFTMNGITPKGNRQSYRFTFSPLPLQQLDLKLPPHEERQFLATHGEIKKENLLFLWYLNFGLPLTKGFPAKVRIRNAYLNRLDFVRFHFERLVFLLPKLSRRMIAFFMPDY